MAQPEKEPEAEGDTVSWAEALAELEPLGLPEKEEAPRPQWEVVTLTLRLTEPQLLLEADLD